MPAIRRVIPEALKPAVQLRTTRARFPTERRLPEFLVPNSARSVRQQQAPKAGSRRERYMGEAFPNSTPLDGEDAHDYSRLPTHLHHREASAPLSETDRAQLNPSPR